jgi:hypothetical protein
MVEREWADSFIADLDAMDLGPVTDSHHQRPLPGGAPPAVTCFACHKPTTGELWVRPDHRGEHEWEPTYFCEGCAHIPIPSEHGDFTYTIADGTDDPADCGWCGRRFHARAHWRIYCTSTCGDRAKAARYRDAHRPEPTSVTCPCGRSFTPARTDARYCSNACRQRAYRQRG